MYNDFHIHTSFSSDSETLPERQIEQAIKLKMDRICITDHEDIGYSADNGLSFTIDPNEYFSRLEKLKQKYSDSLRVLIGIELGLQKNQKSKIDVFSSSYEFDFIIGSTHTVGGKDPCFSDFFETNTEYEAITAYFEEVLKNVKEFDNFDVVGHIDYIVRYTNSKGKNYNCRDYFDIVDEILKVVISKGKGIECNTSRIGCGYLHSNPHEDIIRRYRELGGEIITIGSDSHITDTLGHEFEKAGEILKCAGFKYYTVFEKRKPEFLRI